MFTEFELSGISLDEEAKDLLKPLCEEESTEILESFEAAVKATVKQVIAEQVVPHFESEAQRVVEEEVNETTEKVSDYLQYVVKEFVEEKEAEIKESIETRNQNEFVSKLKGLMEEHSIALDEETSQVVEKMNERIEELTNKLEENQDELIEMRSREQGRKCERVFDQLSEGLSLSQKEKFLMLVEDLDVNDVELFEQKASRIKDTFFGKRDEEEEVSEETDESEDIVEELEDDNSEEISESKDKPAVQSPYELAGRFASAK